MGCEFIFCMHNHQPVGNFEHVFEWGYRDCYGKALSILKKYPEFRFAVHHSGPLLEWIEAHAPEYIDTLAMLVERGQIEIIGGGFYEPIFSIIAEADIRGQLGLMQGYCRKRFGTAPKGFWTAERVWDPEIPRLVSGLGLEYTILDDNHFRYAGIEEDGLLGHYLTERLEHPLRVFPIDRYLRYSIPFKLPDETIAYFKEKTDRLGECSFVYGDDGEKFGMWPGTHKWVYEEKWLVNFIEAVLKQDWIRMTLPSEHIASRMPLGRVYLTQGSYFELSEWALPSRVAADFKRIHREIKDSGRESSFYPFLKGGIWNNFLNKYPESNALNKRTLLLSREIGRYESEAKKDLSDIKRELYKGECNCAYWHGLFGGVYLSSLRHALHEHVLRAEGLLLGKKGQKGFDVLEGDLWNEGGVQILIRSVDFSAMLAPRWGGTVAELGIHSKSFNIFNVMPRRYEAYHDDLMNLNEDEVRGDEVKSIHEAVLVKERGLKERLVYDSSRRYSFKDLVFKSVPAAEDLMKGIATHAESGGRPYSHAITRDAKGVSVLTRGSIEFEGSELQIEKRLEFISGLCGVRARMRVEGKAGLWYGSEININLLGGHDEDRYYELPGVGREDSYLDSTGLIDRLHECVLVDRYNGLRIAINSSREVSMLRYPVFTVSQSDRGFEKNYQGCCLIFFYRLGDGAGEISLELAVG